jgi:hypothetical protein
VIAPVADAAALFERAPYLTRLYTTTGPDERTVDPAFDYDMDLAQVSNVHIARQVLDCGPSLDPHDAPWRMKLPQGGVIVGKGSVWPVPADAAPANLEIVDLATGGQGTVVKDNREAIGTSLFKTAGTAGDAIEVARPPQNGAMIGGAQSVTYDTRTVAPRGETAATYDAPPAGGSRCSVARAGAGTGSSVASWVPLAGAIVARRRRVARQRARTETRRAATQRAAES